MTTIIIRSEFTNGRHYTKTYNDAKKAMNYIKAHYKKNLMIVAISGDNDADNVCNYEIYANGFISFNDSSFRNRVVTIDPDTCKLNVYYSPYQGNAQHVFSKAQMAGAICSIVDTPDDLQDDNTSDYNHDSHAATNDNTSNNIIDKICDNLPSNKSFNVSAAAILLIILMYSILQI